MSTVIAGTLGGAVTIYPQGGEGVAITGIVRQEQVELPVEGGATVWAVERTLKAPADDLAGLDVGDRVDSGGVQYRVLQPLPVENPAADALSIFVLEDWRE